MEHMNGEGVGARDLPRVLAFCPLTGRVFCLGFSVEGLRCGGRGIIPNLMCDVIRETRSHFSR